jgi:hypothetical protein
MSGTVTEKLEAERRAAYREREAATAKAHDAERTASELYGVQNAIREAEIHLEALAAAESEAAALRERVAELRKRERSLTAALK